MKKLEMILPVIGTGEDIEGEDKVIRPDPRRPDLSGVRHPATRKDALPTYSVREYFKDGTCLVSVEFPD